MQLDWLRVFWPTSQEQDFPKHRICAGTQQIINIFITEQILGQLTTKFFFKFKKPIFGPSPQYWGEKMFFKKIGLSSTTS